MLKIQLCNHPEHFFLSSQHPTFVLMSFNFLAIFSMVIKVSVVYLQEKKQSGQHHHRTGDVTHHFIEPQREVVGNGFGDDVVNLLLATTERERRLKKRRKTSTMYFHVNYLKTKAFCTELRST